MKDYIRFASFLTSLACIHYAPTVDMKILVFVAGLAGVIYGSS